MKHGNRPTAIGKLLVAAALLASAVAIACTEDVPTSPVKTATPTKDASKSSIVAALSCHANITELSVTCEAPGAAAKPKPTSDPESTPANIIIGGQDVFVAVKSTNVNYNAGTGAFTFDVTIRNLIPQPMGTADTTGLEAPDPDGIRIFFAAGPNVTSGSGLITVNGDGVDTFTGANQPYYQYSTVLDQFEISSPKTWNLTMPPSVTTFDFILLVSAEVPRPDGYIDLQVSQLRPPDDRQMSFVVRNANGTPVGSPGTITWSVSDTTRATVDANGLVNPLRAGAVTIIAENGTRVGSLTVNVKAIRRIWTGSTDNHYENGANWYPDGIVPVATDTAVVPDTTSAVNFPTLFQNEDIGGIEVEDLTPGGVIPSISLGAFNLTASGDVCTNSAPCSGGPLFGSANINSSSGSLILTGIARTLRGALPRINVTGTYSLDGNITVSQRIRVQSGRLRSTGFRIRQNP
jgi:hypothetical protein